MAVSSSTVAPASRLGALCTFDFDPDRFNASLFPQLTSRGRTIPPLIIADAGTSRRSCDAWQVLLSADMRLF